jgi:hypothetical protein
MIKKYYKIERKNIIVVQFIMEGYEGMATVSTLDARKAILAVSIMPDYISEVTGLLDYLQNKYPMQETHDDQDYKR